ncbi:MAG: serine hydrolase [Calditrichaeota bacterium]|nr:MAG: serine hydrolase [Calditrichota bacterium]
MRKTPFFLKTPFFPILILLIILSCEKKPVPSLRSEFLNKQISHLVDSLNAEIAVAFHDIETGQEFYYNEKSMLHAASTMKVPVMIEIFRMAERGEVQLDEKIEVKNSFYSIVDSSIFSLDINEDGGEALYDSTGKQVAIRDLIYDMITRSSNLATNLLIALADAKNVTATMRKFGAENIQVLRGVEDIKAFRKGWSNYTDAYDMAVIMRAIATSTAASEESCKEMIDILGAQFYRKKIPAGLPDSVHVVNKTGSITAISHDCAIVYPPQRKPYVLVVLTKGIAEPAVAENAIAAISKSIYNELMQNSN